MSPEVTYLRARYDEEEAFYQASVEGDLYRLPYLVCKCGRSIYLGAPGSTPADLAAKRKILDLHDQWPMLLETPPVMEMQAHLPGEPWEAHFTQQIDWVTTQQYRRRFGHEPPTSPIIRALLQPYADRDDFDPAWVDDAARS